MQRVAKPASLHVGLMSERPQWGRMPTGSFLPICALSGQLIPVAADVAAIAPLLVKGLSYSATSGLAGDMRRPDRTEIEAVMVGFVIYVPLAYYTVRFVIGLI